MITVGEVYKISNGDKIKIACDFIHDGNEQTLWYETSSEFEDFISIENCNSFFIILFLYAFNKQEDIIFETPVSKKLHYGVENYLQEIFLLQNKNLKKINLKCDFVDNQYESKGIATAMSLGVDSFDTLLDRINSDDKITHLTIFNAGAFGQNGGDVSRRYFNVMKNTVQDLSSELSLQLLWVDTNLNEILNIPFVETCVFRNISCALLFEKKIGIYYYSTAVPFENMNVCRKSPEDQELVRSYALSTESLDIRLSGLFRTRVEKTKGISNYDVTNKYLNVCIVTSDYKNVKETSGKIENCSRCYKCIRTMVTLDVIGELTNYGEVFDLELYGNNREKYLAETLYHYYRSKELNSVQIKKQIHENKYTISFKVYYYLLIRAIQPILKSLKPNIQ